MTVSDLIRGSAAVALLATGLWNSAYVLGVIDVTPVFVEAPFNVQFGAVALSLVTLCAATGLWMRGSWGLVLWIATVLLEFVLAVRSAPDLPGVGRGLVLHGLMLAAYLLLVATKVRKAETHDEFGVVND